MILLLSTGYSMGCAAAIILNLIIPNEAMEMETPLPTKAIEEEEKEKEVEVAPVAVESPSTAVVAAPAV